MNGLRISPDLTLPRDAVTSTLIVYGGKGMGKTNFGGVLVEELTKAHLRWSVLDPLGVWWGMRHSIDGKGPGIECLILGGIHGDIPIEPTGGAVVADLVIDEAVNVIIDFSRSKTGKIWSVGEKIRFVTDYTVHVFERQGEIINGRRHEPFFQILDESARYIPQVIPSGAVDLAKCVGAWEQFVEEGRNFGLGVGLLTQRSARMNKSVSELADMIVAFRIVGPRSIKAITDWLGEHVEKEQVNENIKKIRQLDVGDALIVSPGWLKYEKVAHIRMRETFDSSATPKPGEHRHEPKHAAKPDLAKYQERMAATIERAKAEDPRELRAKVAKLEKELAKGGARSSASNEGAKHAPAADPAAIARAVEKAITVERHRFAVFVRHVDGLLQRMNNAQADHHATVSRLVAPISIEVTALNDLLAAKPVVATVHTNGKQLTPATAKALDQVAHAAARHIDDSGRNKSVVMANGDGADSLGAGERKVAIALAQHPEDRLSVAEIMILVAQKLRTVQTYLSRLRGCGFIQGDGHDGVGITQSCLDWLGDDIPRLPTGAALREYWLERLPDGEAALLRVICEAYPDACSTPAMMAETGQALRTVQTYLSRLRARRLIEGDARAGIRASKDLF